MAEQKEKRLITKYYQALIDEEYEKAFELLYLYDYDPETEDSKLIEGTAMSGEEAKKFYLKKIELLKEKNYKMKDFQIGEVEYEDGHAFWHHLKVIVEMNGETFEWTEVAHTYKDKLLIGGRDDPYIYYRDGNMNFDIEEEF